MCPGTVVVRGILVALCVPSSSSSTSSSSCAPCTAVHRQRHHGRPCAAVPAERSKRARHHGRPLLSRTSTPQRP
uniref:Secreted protein n=1 Tax=Anopheles coluzzii TaxID=1518534 RepID=A0A6E8W8Y6_ANOCL